MPWTPIKKDDDTTTTDEPTLESVQAERDRLAAIVGLSAEERAHFDALPEEMRTSFLGKSAEGRRAEIVAKNDADPVVYTTIDGVEIRKSAGETLIAMAKKADAQERELAEMRKSAEQTLLEKRADTELSHLPGDLKVRAEMLKAIDGISDATTREAALASLRSKNDIGKAAFTTYGHMDSSVADNSAEGELEKITKRIMESEKLTYHQAYAKALVSPEGQVAYAKSLEESK